jgi:hypothetical protein
MPRSLDPSSRFTIVLASDLDKPRDTQPRLFGKPLTAIPQRDTHMLLEKLSKGTPSSSMYDEILDAAMKGLTGWENISAEFGRESLGNIYQLDELVEVLSFLVSESIATPEVKKKSESPLSSDAVNSASPALVSAGL